MQSEGYQKSNALEISFRGKPIPFFTGQARYTLGKTYNNTSGINCFPANSYFPHADWGRSEDDRRNKCDLLGIFEAGKWFHLGTAFSMASGKPVNSQPVMMTTTSLPLDRPVRVPRNAMHGPRYVNLWHDLLMTKRGAEGPVSSISINSFNVFNHRNDLTYIGVLGSPFFGHAVAALPARRMQLNLEVKF